MKLPGYREDPLRNRDRVVKGALGVWRALTVAATVALVLSGLAVVGFFVFFAIAFANYQK